MKRIASFEVDHTCLLPGMYLSRQDGNVVTYDLRFIRPNTPPFLPSAVMHTIEHIFATYVRNSRFGENIVYFGPMGCRTGVLPADAGHEPRGHHRIDTGNA